MQQISLKLRIQAVYLKRDNLFINKEDERHETPSDAASDSSILFLLACKPWTIQTITMWSKLFNSMIYCKWIIRGTATLDY